MAIAKTKAAIIDGVLVPAAEVSALKALVLMDRPATVPELARSMNDKMSDASLYSLLGRLAEQRGLVSREERLIEVHGSRLKRIFWRPNQASISYFGGSENTDATREKESATPAWTPG